MTTITSVVIGSRPAVPETTVQVTANVVQEDLTFPAGDYYLDHSTASLSLVSTFATMLDSHSELAGSAAIITRSGLQRITNAVAFSVDNWGGTILRDLLGFTTTLGSATVQLSPNSSPLYWSPGKPESTAGRQGSDGLLVKDTRAARSAPGRVVATQNNTWFKNGVQWRFVKIDRMQTVPNTNGTWFTVWDEVVSRYRRFFIARDVIEDLTDDVTAISIASRIPSVGRGAYILNMGGPVEQIHRREFGRLELFNNVELPVQTAAEYP